MTEPAFHRAYVGDPPAPDALVDIADGIKGIFENGKFTSYDFDPAKFTEETAKEWLKKNGLSLSWFESAKNRSKYANASPSFDYLKAFHKFVKGHAMIYDQIKAEIHKKARGSAGGQARAKRALEGGGDEEIDLEDIMEGETPVKVTNAAYVDGDIIETEEYFDVPTVFTKEGVWTGTNGVPTLKTFEALKASAPWFMGAPITPTHIETDTIRPSDRRLGHVISATAREDKRDVFGVSRYYKSLLTDDEQTKIKNRENVDGSPGYFTPVRSETGDFDGKQYQAVEIGPYVVTEYATFFDGTHGACDSASGCGPFQNAKSKKDEIKSDDKLVLDKNGKVTKCPKKQKNEADQMTEELEKKLNSATTEIESLKAELEKLKNAAPVDIKPLEDKIADLSTKFENKAKTEGEAKEAAYKEAFRKQLNAAASTEIDALWPIVKDMNPMQYEAWKFTNSGKLLTEAEKKAATGKKLTDAAGDLVAQAKAKADANLLKRR